MAEKNYIKGFVKERVFDNGGKILNVSINVEQLNDLPVDKYGNVKLIIAKRRNPGQYGDTHYVYEDTFVPKGQSRNVSNDTSNEESLPF